MPLGAVIAISCVLLAALLGFLGFVGKTLSELTKSQSALSVQIAVMNQGASIGAQNLIRTATARIDLLEDVAEQFGDRLHSAERRLELIRNAHPGGMDIPEAVWRD